MSLLRFVLTMIPDRNAAEDVVQETARSLWQKLEDYDPGQPFWPWARKFAYLEVLKYRRAQALERRYFSDALVERLAEDHEAQSQALELRRRALAECLAKLDAGARRLVMERYGGELSVAEIAGRAGKSANAISMMLHRIRQRLLECINGWLLAGEATA
jgi:RNA polymerase sigma-70 factor (ECF subfamily)